MFEDTSVSKLTFTPTQNHPLSIAYIRSEFYGAAITDAETAILLDPKYVKAYYRRAVGHMALGKLKGWSQIF
jgi:Tfp pilus assembly protein PilF